METVAIGDVESTSPETDAEVRPLADPLGTTDVAVNHFPLEPGERYALGAPPDSEEARVPLPRPSCGHGERRPELADDRDSPVDLCLACGASEVI